MVMAKDEIRESRLERREVQAKALEEQLEKMGEQLYEETKRKCQKQLDEIARREAVLEPREVAVTEAEGSVQARGASADRRERSCSQVEAGQHRESVRLAELGESTKADSKSLKEAQAQQQRLYKAEMEMVEQKRVLLRQEFDQREERLHTDTVRSNSQAAILRRREDALEGKEQEVGSRLTEAEAVQDDAKGKIAQRTAQLDQREKTLEESDKDVTRREKAVATEVKAIGAVAQTNNSIREDLEQLRRGLEKSKLDIGIKEGRVKHIQVVLKAVVQHDGLRAQLEKLVKKEELADVIGE